MGRRLDARKLALVARGAFAMRVACAERVARCALVVRVHLALVHLWARGAARMRRVALDRQVHPEAGQGGMQAVGGGGGTSIDE